MANTTVLMGMATVDGQPCPVTVDLGDWMIARQPTTEEREHFNLPPEEPALILEVHRQCGDTAELYPFPGATGTVPLFHIDDPHKVGVDILDLDQARQQHAKER